MATMAKRRLPSENPLLLFVSSVMNRNLEDLEWARDTVVSVVGETPFLRTWLFEYSPASSEDVASGYLAKVREADFFVWLVGATTTSPVRQEVREALNCNARMLIFVLPVDNDERSSETEDLLREVGSNAKYAPVHSRESLGTEIEEALSDELVRAVRTHPGVSHLDPWIEKEARHSRLRCIQGWVSAGVSYSVAATLADDDSVGPSLMREFEEGERVRLIVGPLGSGKSLAANRILQRAIQSHKYDSQAAIPIHIAGDVLAGSSLEEALLARLPGREALSIDQGVFAVIDDVTQISSERCLELFAEAKSLVERSPHSTLTFTRRELGELDIGWPYARISMLEESAALDIVNKVSGGVYSTVDLRYRWPESVRSSIQTPLFAVLLGNYLRNLDGRSPRSAIETVRNLADKVMSRSSSDQQDVRESLCRLARLCIGQQGAMVAKSNVGDESDVRRLVATGLVRAEGNTIGFILQLIRDWYGSLALKQRLPAPTDIVQDRSILDSWHESLLLLIRGGDYDTAFEYLDQIANHDPGYAATAVHEAIDKWPDDSSPSLPPENECEERMHSCMASWVSGIGDLAMRIAPIDDHGQVLPIRAKTDQNALRFAWFGGDASRDGVPDLPRGILTTGADALNWRGATFTHVSSQSSWPWRLTLESLVSNLEQLLRNHHFVPQTGIGLHEAVWNCALGMLDLGSLRRDAIPLNRIRVPSSIPDEAYMPGRIRGLRAQHFRMLAHSLADRGGSELPPPWPTADLQLAGKSGLILSTYSAERLRSRLEVIFSGALEMYRQLVETWFKPFSTRMSVYSLLPVQLQGVLRHTPESCRDKSVLFWYMQPITDEADDKVKIQLGDPRSVGGDRNLLDTLHSLANESRPDRGRFASVSTHTTAASSFVHSYPTMNLAYSWLWTDLENLKWIDGMHHDLY